MKDVCFLIVDDCRPVITMVRKVIESRFGTVNVLEASNGQQAIEILNSQHVDIILSDWHMPEMSGEELLFHVRNDEKLKELPFIMMTSEGGRDFIVTAVQNGVSQYVVKPFSAETLEDKIRKSWNGAVKRKNSRIAGLPDHQLALRIDGKTFSAQAVNMSLTGALIQMEYSEEIRLFREIDLSLEFISDDQMKSYAINPLEGRVVRIEAEDSFHPSSRKCQIALYFPANSMDKTVEIKLKELLDYLNSLNPDIIKDE